jgi:pimeloyl-ACP methyl ester carboxylesterase
MRDNIGVVFIHGAGLGGWIWRDVVKWISVPALAAEFPERNPLSGVDKSLTFDDYSSHLISQIKKMECRRVVLVAHSIGGVLALKLAAKLKNNVAGIIGIGASIPSGGGSFVSSLPWINRIVLNITMPIFGTRPPASAIKKGLCDGLTPKQTEEVVSRFVPESTKLYFGESGEEFPGINSAYIKLLDDREFSIDLQDSMIRNMINPQVFEIKAGHMCMLQCPEVLADIVNRFVQAIDTPASGNSKGLKSHLQFNLN